MKTSETPHVEACWRYCDDIIAGAIPACEMVKLACERAKRDLAASEADDYPYTFDAAKAERVCKFVRALPHTKGKWAAKREPFVVQPFQAFIVCQLFGWVRKKDGLRRFRKALVMLPRKNGKSDIAARIGLYMFAADNEHGAEVYSGATTEKQAWEVFRPALMMAKATPAFLERYGVQTFKRSIAIPETAARFEPLIGKPGDGSSPSCAIVDEYHEHATDDLTETMRTGMGAREQPLLLQISTAGSNTSGPCFMAQQEAERMLRGLVQDDELFALLYGIDNTEQVNIVQSSDALRKLEEFCSCDCANVALVEQSWRRAYAALVMTRPEGWRKSFLQSGASTIPTGPSGQGDFAEAATSSSFSTPTPTTSGDKSSSGSGGPRETPMPHARQRRSTSQNSTTTNATATDERTTSNPFTELHWLSTSEGTQSRADVAQSAPSRSPLYALITATRPGQSGASFAGNVILQSVFSETMKSACAGHSHTCEVRQRIKPAEDGVRWEVRNRADDWTDPETLRKANPNFDVSVSGEFLLSQHRDAMQNARLQSAYQTKHLNRWVGARSAFFDLPKWLACKREIALDDFKGKRCWLGLDLASTVDVNALALLFQDGERFSLFAKYYMPEATVELGHNQHFQAWAREGWLTVTDGEMVDMMRIKDDIVDLASRFSVVEMAYDPFQATMLVTELMKEGVTCVEMRPTVLNFSSPMKHLDGLIRSGKLEHPGDPVMTWMVGNVTALMDAKDNVYPRKERPENKIDGVVATLAALARQMNGTEKGRSYLDAPGASLVMV